MGLLKAIIIVSVSIFLANLITKFKKKLKKFPLIGDLFYLENFYLYSIITIMTVMILLF